MIGVTFRVLFGLPVSAPTAGGADSGDNEPKVALSHPMGAGTIRRIAWLLDLKNRMSGHG
jgi:hypothetical protein